MPTGQLQGTAPTAESDTAPVTDTEALRAYTARRDEAAFRVLVDRHGPMVLRVCRQVTGDRHAAEDAFQATFLALVKQAGSVEVRGTLAGWLCGVAYRVAQRVRADAARRLIQERRVTVRLARDDTDAARTEIQRLLHEEVARLPADLRDPVVLTYLEGRSNEEAATALGCPVGTVKSRLNRGRERLRQRLAVRGLALSVGLLFVDLGKASAAGVPPALADRAVRLARDPAAADPRLAALAALADAAAPPSRWWKLLALIVAAGALTAGLAAAGGWACSLGVFGGPGGGTTVTAPCH